jgi:flavin reductase (DIM6/NTAB) family NADH-FMN oxidoreductase RutF
MNHNGNYHWIRLKEPKQWSRLLYPNPVCFLCTETVTTTKRRLLPNVMVVSWMTAINNAGTFMFSINKRRTGSYGRPYCYQYDDHTNNENDGRKGDTTTTPNAQSKDDIEDTGDKRNVLHASSSSLYHESSSIFAIDGTVAHMVCQTTKKSYHPAFGMEKDHIVIIAQITDAYVLDSYWDSSKNIFRPQPPPHAPYSTFLGSQEFGHVMSSSSSFVSSASAL